MRHFGEAGIKLLGVYFAASALIGMASVAASFAVPQTAGLPSGREWVVAYVLPVVGVLIVAGLCLFGGKALAARIFTEDGLELTGLSRRDLLVVGLSLGGVSIALSGVSGLVQIGGKALWYAEGSRQSLFGSSMEGAWQPLVNNALELVIGGALTAGAGRLASVLDTRYSGGSNHESGELQ
jgi:hypothetical protein